MDPRITTTLGQVGRGMDRPTLIGVGDEMARAVAPTPMRSPSMWDRAKRIVGKRSAMPRTTARGARR